MKDQRNPKGPWIHRFAIRLFTGFFTLLVFWLLNFLDLDIGSLDGPEYAVIEAKHIDSKLLEQSETIENAIRNMELEINKKRESMTMLSDSSKNLQKTMTQLIELQRLAIQKAVALSDVEQANLATSLAQFLENQRTYQGYNTELSNFLARKHELEAQAAKIQSQIEQQRRPAQVEYETLTQSHLFRLAYLKLMVLLPLLIIGALLLVKMRSSLYYPLVLGYGIAIIIKVFLVIYDYFPSKYLKYVVIIGLIVVVAKLLVYFIRAVAFPKTQWLLTQYREAYESFLCPVCEYPIRTGPRKFLFWTRHTVNKVVLPKDNPEDKPYTCPVCGTNLFEQCTKCQGIRHSLLPYCQHCQTEKTI